MSISLRVPDLWQQEAIRTLDAGSDVVVHAPTGAGKTYIFELLIERGWRRQAVYTVPTRALANDKLNEWRKRGWNVGITTGDVVEKPDAPVVVATLETQKARLLRRHGPALLVIDEYQLLADSARGTNYELAIALAPAHTQLLLLSGSVGNPDAIVEWLRRLGRDAVLVHHRDRPVPLEEVYIEALPDRAPASVRGFWPRIVARALLANLGPVLIFAPQRKAAERLARHLAAALPVLDPLVLSREQEILAGDRLAKLLKVRVAFHHSGLSYAQRAGLVEPLAKAGQLRAVVATTGLAAGINFSMRSVLVTETEYTTNNTQQLIRPDELLQMFGRAGRRGLDEVGYVLVAPERPRLSEARALNLRRPVKVEWPGILAVMQAAVEAGEPPLAAAVSLGERLFSPQLVPLGVEHSLKTGVMPCDINIDAERASHARPLVVEMLNSRESWEPKPEPENVHLGEVVARVGDRWQPALSAAEIVGRIGRGSLCLLSKGRQRRYGREIPLAMRDEKHPQRIVLLKSVRRMLASAQRDHDDKIDSPRAMPRVIDDARLRTDILPLVPVFSSGGTLFDLVERKRLIVARVSFDELTVLAHRDCFGTPVLDPPERKAYPVECQNCAQLATCETQLGRGRSPALAWLRLGLIDPLGTPTRRGVLFSFFHHGEGLAIAAALEDEAYDIPTLLVDLANLRAGHRFADHAGKSSRLAAVCRKVYGDFDFDGYVHRGVPVHYGDGAAEVLAEVQGGRLRTVLLSEELRAGDVERARLEWLSLLRHVIHAPDLDWARWREMQEKAARLVRASDNRVLVSDLPSLLPLQTRRIEHRLRFG